MSSLLNQPITHSAIAPTRTAILDKIPRSLSKSGSAPWAPLNAHNGELTRAIIGAALASPCSTKPRLPFKPQDKTVLGGMGSMIVRGGDASHERDILRMVEVVIPERIWGSDCEAYLCPLLR